MKKIFSLCTVCAGLFAFVSNAAYATLYSVTGIATMYDASGAVTGIIDNNLIGSYDDSDPTSLEFTSGQPFFGFFWAATGHVHVEGTHAFEACLTDGSTHCTPPAPISMTVGQDQWGGHFLVGWSVNHNIDVLNVWDVITNPSGTIHLLPTDPDGDGILGVPIVDGPFNTGFSWSYDLTLTPHTIPIPPTIWLFCSGLIGLIGISRRKKVM